MGKSQVVSTYAAAFASIKPRPSPPLSLHHWPRLSSAKSSEEEGGGDKDRVKEEVRREMAQNKDETAELKLKSTLCVNNCGRPGNPTTKNMCQSCYKASLAIDDPIASCSGQDKPRPCPASEDPQVAEREEGKTTAAAGVVVVDKKEGEGKRVKVEEARVRAVNRCAGCRRKVGLTGFRCRCGDLFCAEHRYSDRHACRFDYKAAGREQIARENPVFKAPKILRF